MLYLAVLLFYISFCFSVLQNYIFLLLCGTLKEQIVSYKIIYVLF